MPARIKEVHSQLHSFLYISTGPVCYCDVPIHSVFFISYITFLLAYRKAEA